MSAGWPQELGVGRVGSRLRFFQRLKAMLQREGAAGAAAAGRHAEIGYSRS